MRKIKLIGPVDYDMYEHFSDSLDELLAKNSTKSIAIELNSDGGVAIDALAIVGKMATAGVRFHVTVYGRAMSAAILILAACQHRQMSSEAWLMYHEDAGKFKGSTSDMSKAALRFEQEEQQWADLLQKYTGRPASHWRAMAKATTYFSAEEALKVGLIDEIVRG